MQAGAQPDVAHRAVGAAPPFHERRETLLRKTLDLPEAEADGVAGADDVAHPGMARKDAGGVEGGFLQRAVPLRMIDVDGAYLHAVVAGVAHELRGLVEAHGLGVQDRGAEHVRIVGLEPAGGVDEKREGRGMAFRKTVFAESLDLVEAVFREHPVVAALNHAADHLLLEGVNRSGAPEGRHGAAQFIGLAGLETAGHDRDLHRLLLKERNAQRLAEYLFQLRLRIFDPLLFFAAAQIGVHHVALDRAGTHDRHLDDKVVEAARSQPRQHRHLGAGFDLETHSVSARQIMS